MNEMTQERKDAAQKAAAYAGLARNYLNNGETWMAVHAQVASDLFAAKAVCGFDPSLLVDDNGASPFAEYLSAAPKSVFSAKADSHAVIEYIRAGVEELVPEAHLTGWRSTLAPIDGFANRLLGSDLLASAFVSARLGDLAPDAFVIARFEEAAEFYALASEAELAEDFYSAIKARHKGDLATFEAWLVQRSIDVNDTALIQTTLRWDLAMHAIESLGELPEDPQVAARTIRSRMAWALGPEDARKFAALFVAS